MSSPREDASQVVPAATRVLVVDDDEDVAWVIAEQLREGGARVRVTTSARAAREALARERFDAVLSDVRMPGEDGLALLEYCRAHHRDVAFLLLTAVDEVVAAVDAVKRGAANYLVKPATAVRLYAALDEALCERRPRIDTRSELVGESAVFRAALDRLDRAAASELSVCVVGETGVGKELFARRAHLASPRRDGPFVALNVAAIPADLFEVELFGAEKGAYTGALRGRAGAVESAEGGTLFFDEIGELSLPLQAKLLRLLEERTFRRVGGANERRADVRFVSATNRDLSAEVSAGRFRADLLYRVQGFVVAVPPLRERRDDVRRLAEHFLSGSAGSAADFLDEASRRHQRRPQIEPGAWARLMEHDWPGNVRELRNVMERVASLGERVVSEASLVELLVPDASPERTEEPSLADRRRALERTSIEKALARHGGNKTAAARTLGISRRTLYYRLRELGLEAS